MRVADELRGNSASLSRAANCSSGGSERSSAIALSRARFDAMRFTSCARRRFLSTELFFAMGTRVLGRSVDERHLEATEEGLRLRMGPRRRDEDDVHAAHGIDLVVVDLREHQLLLEAEREIAAPVEALAGDAAEVTYARQGNADEPVEELVHALAPQRHLPADRHVLSHLERGDRCLVAGDDPLLSAQALKRAATA